MCMQYYSALAPVTTCFRLTFEFFKYPSIYRQVSIARAILKGSPILLCDEPTSSLDSETELDIMNNIKSISLDRTTVIIAHRLSTVQDCDQIIVMHQGRVVESGTHDELVRLGGRYTELLKMQESSDDAETKQAP